MRNILIPYIILFSCLNAIGQETYRHDQNECLEYGSVRIIPYKNEYYPGRRSGIEIVQNGSRIITGIDLRDKPVPIPDGIDTHFPELISSIADRENNTHLIKLKYPEYDFEYSISIKSDWESINITFNADSGRTTQKDIFAMLELYPGDYIGKSWNMDNQKTGIFPRQFNGNREKGSDGSVYSVALSTGKNLILSPEDEITRCRILSYSGEIELHDGRASSNHKWFVVQERVPSGKSGKLVEWEITPTNISNWSPEPVIGLSQAGYHPAGPKFGVIETGKAKTSALHYKISQVLPDGKRKLIKNKSVQEPEYFYQRNYYKVDFSDIKEPGVYEFVLDENNSETFTISGDCYDASIWQSALTTFLPVQMCHMEVRDRIRLWHKACHMDDAVRAPDGEMNWLEYFQDTAQTYDNKPLEHIEGLNQGGWHDAGDFQMPVAANSRTVYNLCLAFEEFGISKDATSIDFENGITQLHTPDGQYDIIQQIRHGLNYLLASYRGEGYSYAGIIAGDWLQYLELGEADNKTDNIPDFTRGEHKDDRYVFTSRNKNLEFVNSATFAIAHRVLKDYYPQLADECLYFSMKAWENGKNFDFLTPGSYISNFTQSVKLHAATELYLTVKDPEFEKIIVEILSKPGRFTNHYIWAVSRIRNPEFLSRNAELIKENLEEWKSFTENEFDNPYGISFSPKLFGLGYYNLSLAVRQYYLNKHYPDLFDSDYIFRVINYFLGVHPADNRSLITGIGKKSVTEAFGFNRSDFSYIPGGVVSGPAIIQPDFFEFRDNDPFFWIQTEYTTSSSAAFIFVANAARKLVIEEMIR